MNQNRCKQQGFTLIEVMVVVVILGILAAILVPKVMDRPDQARKTKASLDIQALEGALKMYKMDNYVYPNTDQGLEALVEKPLHRTRPTGSPVVTWTACRWIPGNNPIST